MFGIIIVCKHEALPNWLKSQCHNVPFQSSTIILFRIFTKFSISTLLKLPRTITVLEQSKKWKTFSLLAGFSILMRPIRPMAQMYFPPPKFQFPLCLGYQEWVISCLPNTITPRCGLWHAHRNANNDRTSALFDSGNDAFAQKFSETIRVQPNPSNLDSSVQKHFSNFLLSNCFSFGLTIIVFSALHYIALWP